MAQAHGDRLTAVDASFLAQESQNAHMHIGAVMVFEGPPPAFDDFADHVRSRLHLVPRYRQKLAVPPIETGRPLWVDDPSFNLEYHLRHTALPEPGGEDQLRALAARIHSQRLDRTKPLWELWLVQGLEDNRFALISKTHHALVDGVAGVDLATVLFDLEPVPPPIPHEGEPWVPQPEPSAAAMAARGVRGLVELPFSLAGRALRASRARRCTRRASRSKASPRSRGRRSTPRRRRRST
jgi:diacylglycerol O-acyltransferase / wax synthase